MIKAFIRVSWNKMHVSWGKEVKHFFIIYFWSLQHNLGGTLDSSHSVFGRQKNWMWESGEETFKAWLSKRRPEQWNDGKSSRKIVKEGAKLFQIKAVFESVVNKYSKYLVAKWLDIRWCLVVKSLESLSHRQVRWLSSHWWSCLGAGHSSHPCSFRSSSERRRYPPPVYYTSPHCNLPETPCCTNTQAWKES